MEQRGASAKAISTNVTWLAIDRIIRMGVMLGMSVWMARYLGTAAFGQYAYALAFVQLFSVVAAFGLENVVIRDIVRETAPARLQTLGSAWRLQQRAALLTWVFAVVVVGVWKGIAHPTFFLVLSFSLILLAKSSEVFRLAFAARVDSRWVVWTENAVLVGFALLKGLIMLLGGTVGQLALATGIEFALLAVAFAWVYQHVYGDRGHWRVDRTRMKTLAHDAWPMVLSGFAVMVFMRTDQIMLGELVGDDAVGIYSAAVRVSEIAYILPSILVGSLYPSLIRARERDAAAYRRGLQQLFRAMMLFALCLIVGGAWLAEPLMIGLYGASFAESGRVLAWLLWATIPVNLGLVAGKWFVAEGLQRLTFYRMSLGAVVNIALNAWAIPRWGVYGAAMATIAAQLMANVLFNATHARAREVFWMEIRAIVTGGLSILPVLIGWIRRRMDRA